MLIEAGIKEDTVFAYRAANGAAKLLLAVVGLAGSMGCWASKTRSRR